MRVFYLFDVNMNFYDMYREYPYKLYKMYEDLYLTSKYNEELSIRMYKQMNHRFNISFMNNYLKGQNKLEPYYYNKEKSHIISSRYIYSKLKVYTYYITIESNINFVKFFRQLNDYSSNFFVCDFDNNDYFWLEKIVSLDDKLSKSEVKQ